MIKVGLIGFGKTGKIVAKELINEDSINLSWVLRKSSTEENEYAGELLGLHKKEGIIRSMEGLDINGFFNDNPVDIVIDFSNHTTLPLYSSAIEKTGYKLISAIPAMLNTSLILLKSYPKPTQYCTPPISL